MKENQLYDISRYINKCAVVLFCVAFMYCVVVLFPLCVAGLSQDKFWTSSKRGRLLEGGATSTIYEDGFNDVYLVKLALF